MKIIKLDSIVSENEKQITKETRKTAKVFNVNEINSFATSVNKNRASPELYPPLSYEHP